MRIKYILPLILLALIVPSTLILAQESHRDSIPITKEQIQKMTYDQLLELPLDELMKLADIMGMSTDDLLQMFLNMKTGVASVKELSPRESPGILSIITDQEIKAMGARDLIDVLQQVPGFSFGVDVESVIGIGMRGVWGHEGKILLLLDGQECNELSYSTLQLGNHYPVDQIKRIEIIRGPGSVVYGGNAELAVINIITYGAADNDGIRATATYGQLTHSYGRRNLEISAGKTLGALALNANLFAGQGNRSDKVITDFYGQSYNMKGNSEVDPMMINLSASYKGFSARFIADFYKTTQLDVNGAFLDPTYFKAIPTDFTSYLGELKYDKDLSKKVRLGAAITYQYYNSWNVNESSLDQSLLDTANAHYNQDYVTAIQEKPTYRITGKINLAYTPKEKLNFLFGTEAYSETGLSNNFRSTYYDAHGNEVDHIGYNDLAVYGQGILSLGFANLIAGVRMEHHSLVGNSVVPRLGLTRVFDRLHLKLLYSSAFRSPSIEVINLNRSIKPERTQVIELEAGYRITPSMLVTVNVFDNTIRQPIVYMTDTTVIGESYYNASSTGSRGVEVEYKLAKSGVGNLTVGYSFYSTAGKNKVEDYMAYSNGNLLTNAVLAFPQHKLTFHGSLKLSPRFSLNPSGFFLSKRYGCVALDANENPVYGSYDPVFVLNLMVWADDLLKNHLSLGAGVYDLTQSGYAYVQPYVGRPPMPSPGREFVFKAAVHF